MVSTLAWSISKWRWNSR